MGVHGLWKLIDSSGKPIPLEALENRVLAVDVSIWLYQLVKGFQERAGQSVANAYLLGLFHRICKLLFYRIKPIFVFDGGVPALKRKTIAARQSNRSKASLLSEKLKQKLLENLAKQEALGKALGENVVLPKLFQPKQQDSLFSLPPLPVSEENDEDSDSEKDNIKYRYKDLQSIDINSEEFLSLPPDMRHDILTELKETRKQNSWAKLHLMPEVSDEFSDFQMRRLLKRRAIQVGIEKAEGEMGTRGFTISDLQSILSDQGVELSQRIAADSSTRLLYNNKIKELSKEVSSASSSGVKIKPKRSQKVRANSIKSDTDESNSNSEEDVLSLEDGSNNKSLTQAEILELIKQENMSSETGKKSVDKEGSSMAQSEMLKNVKTEEGTELAVNGMAVENEPRNNAVQLEHGSFPQESNNHHQLSTPLPLPQPLSQHQLSESVNAVQNSSNAKIKSVDDVPIFKPDGPCKTEYDETSLDKQQSNIFNKKTEEFCEINIKKEPEDLNTSLSKSPDAMSKPELIPNISFKEGNSSSADSDDDFMEVSCNINTQSNGHENLSLGEKDSPSDIGVLNVIKESNLGSTDKPDNPSSEDSDDDFLEVGENDQNESGVDTNFGAEVKHNSPSVPPLVPDIVKEDSKAIKPLEIVVKAVDTLEDDLFADVFENRVNEETPPEQFTFEEKDFIPSTSNSESSLKKSNSDLPEGKDSYEIDTPLTDSVTLSRNVDTSSPVPQLSVNEIIKMKKDLEQESSYLMKETSREDRIASTITEQIRLDAQELLQLFGIPYIIAPLEAEAQCAYLDLTGQTQGTITDDSDIWLFGGNNVYKNFFDQKKFVQQFKATDIDKCLHIGRDEMIMLALLSGSDYTLGLTGVGAVTALEVIAHYPKTQVESTPVERLKHFAKEFKAKALKGSIARKLKKAELSEGFPSAEVVSAYLDPEVDKSSEAFSWSKPNVTQIRRYAREKFGWDQNKTDKILEPVMENLKKTQTQGTLHRFFEWDFDRIENTQSRRVENALNLLKTPSLLTAPSTSRPRPPLQGKKTFLAENNASLPIKSKTPAQIAREKAAKKFKELKKQGKIGPKSSKK